MKKTIFILLAGLTFGASVEAKTVKTKFKVSGKCEMCEDRIEDAAERVKGVTDAEWNAKTQTLTLVYNDAKTTVAKVQKAIAAAGHDAGAVKASDAAYNKLPGCCQYRTGKADASCSKKKGKKAADCCKKK